KGAIAEKTTDPTLADSFFDVFCEIDMGGGNRFYNQTPLRVTATIDCVPPNKIYFHPVNICIPLYTSPVPGQGIHVGNLVSARHDPSPNPGACCIPDPTGLGSQCIQTTAVQCSAQNGTFQGEGTVCASDTCNKQPCQDGGPGPHWVDVTPAGVDNM